MTDRAMGSENSGNRTTVGIRLLAVMLILVFMGASVFFVLAPGRLHPREVSVRQLYERSSTYVGQKVTSVGYLVNYSAPHFGDDYSLCEGDPRNLYFAVNPCIAVVAAPSTIDSHISFVYNGTDYEVPLSICSFSFPCHVVVSGVFVDRGPVADASQYAIEASSVAWHE
ncbi:MAG: hypothetical protein ABSG74_08835 [Candidatus Bathyarchaeia archaeon]